MKSEIPKTALLHESPGEDTIATRLEAARRGVSDALMLPGIEGQAVLFARLEDLRGAVEDCRASISAGQWGRGAVKALMEDCRRTIHQARAVNEYLHGLVADRTDQSAGVYAASPFRGRASPAGGGSTSEWEG
ncbi:MAG: hypothetical protein LC114_11980 [Bryobacterales bacterium]|nr:hypothetical protein [Bryobacterales bacterium]